MRRFLPIAVVCVTLCAAGCVSQERKNAMYTAAAQRVSNPNQQPEQHRLVGTIEAVNQQGGFVLIDTESAYPAPVGTALKSFLNGTETGVLAVSPEVKPPFMIADIVSGTPQKGDEVFQ